jgi:gluconokinase
MGKAALGLGLLRMPAWIICGVAGAGKTSLGKRLAELSGREFLDADQFHPTANVEKMRLGVALEEADREAWLLGIESALRQRRGRDFVFAFPGLKALHRRRVQEAAGEARIVFLELKPELAFDRLKRRGGFFPPELVYTQFEVLEKAEEALHLDGSLGLEELQKQALAWLEGKSF